MTTKITMRQFSGTSLGPTEKRSTLSTQPARRGPSDLTKGWASRFSSPEYSAESVSAVVFAEPAKKPLAKA